VRRNHAAVLHLTNALFRMNKLLSLNLDDKFQQLGINSSTIELCHVIAAMLVYTPGTHGVACPFASVK
jgi:hypothetical protein